MIITLTTDFGLADPFVGIMKGVIWSIAPDVRLADITHEVRAFDILEAAFVLESSYRYFPKGSIHVVVVDPGVGSERRPLAAAAKGHIFVAPDNGVLSSVLDQDPAVYWVTDDSLFLKPLSRTFHGRDVFAPVAAHLAHGTPIESVGPRIADFVMQALPEPRSEGSKVQGKVLRVDKFGNIITNLRRPHLTSPFSIYVGGVSITRLVSSFSEAERGEFFAFEGSTGYIEVALNQDSAAEKLMVRPGDQIEVETGLVNY